MTDGHTTDPGMSSDEQYAEFRRAEQFLALGHPADAARLLEPLVRAAPEHTAALELHARALFASAQLGRAEQALRRLVERSPDDGWAQIALARTLERLGRPDEASVHRRIAVALGSSEA